MLQAAQLIGSLQYESAKQCCLTAVELSMQKEDAKLCTDSLEILGTVELELGELDAAREVRIFCSRGARTGAGSRGAQTSKEYLMYSVSLALSWP